jgi:peptidoglycan-associated lipoprotein
MKPKGKVILCGIGILLVTVTAGCRKKVPATTAPPVPAAAPAEVPKPSAPSVDAFTIEPNEIRQGESAKVRWAVQDATEVEIDQGIGAVSASGEREVAPGDSTTYTLVAKGPGGTATANATLNVTLPPPAPVAKTIPFDERLNEVQDAFFDYDRANLRDDARGALEKDADVLKAILNDFPTATSVIEGHCDERGSAEYNLGLGDRRASAAMDYLSELGVPGDRLIKVSYGKERPQCTESDESCWQKNRRVHFAPGEVQQPKVTSELQDNGNEIRPTPEFRTENVK